MATTHMVHARKRGQALVEMAITLPLIVTLMLGAADLGRAFYLNIEMAGASRAGMREGIKGASSDLATPSETRSSMPSITAWRYGGTRVRERNTTGAAARLAPTSAGLPPYCGPL